MRGFEMNDAMPSEPRQQADKLAAEPPNMILWSMYEKREKFQKLFQRFVITRAQPEPVHEVRQTPYIGFMKEENNHG